MHHRNVRGFCRLGAPKVEKTLIFRKFINTSKATIEKAFQAIKCFANSKFLVGDNMTIIDLSAYVEIGQLQRQFTNIYDFTNMPNIQRWLKFAGSRFS